MSLNLAQAWKGIPPPPPDVSSAQPVASNGAPGQPDGKGYGPQAPPGGDSPALPPTEQGAVLSGQQPASSSPPQAEEPPRLRSLFEHPLVLPPSDPASDPARLQQLAALVLHRHEDPELDDILAKNPAWHAQASLDDGSMAARAMLGQQIAREVLGESHANEPGLYFLAVGAKLPQSATRQEAYAAICDHYTRKAEQRYVDNKNRRAAWQANRTALEKVIPQVVSGLKTPEQLTAELTPAQLIVYNREFDPAAVGKAHAAFQLLRQAFSSSPEEGLRSMIDQGLSRRITSCLSDTAQSGSAVLNETALELFEVSLKTLMADVQEQSGDQYKFLHNARLALFSPLRKRGDDIRILDATHQAAEQAGTAAIAAGMMEAIGWESGKQNAEARMEMKTGELAALREEWLRHRAADTQETRVLGLLSQGQDLGNQPNDRASFTSRTVNCLGSVVGQTMPFFVPGAGWGIALAGAFDDRRNRAYYAGLEPGTAEWSAFIDAAASTAVEKISFGAIGKFSGAGWFINKLPAASKLRRTLSDALWQRVLFETGAGIAEETVAEPTAEAVIQWVVRNNLAPLAKLDVGGKYDWNNYWQELRGMLSPEQLMATALFVGGLSGMQAPSIRRSLVTYSKNAEMLMTQGIPKEEAQRIASIENASERIAAARQAREKAWGNHEQAAKNAREGMAAFRHLGEVQATIESEAYKYFQKQYNLPTVEEKLDAPGTYAVTVYDRDSGKKKFTQDMTGDQLVALFGRYFSRAEQEEVRRTQSEFAANAFLRAAEATGGIQAQDMLQWGHREDGHPSPPARTSSPASASTAASGQGPQTSSIVPRTSSSARQETSFSPQTGEHAEAPANAADEPISSSGQDLPTSSIVPRTSSIVPQEASLTTLGGFVRAIGAMSQTAFSHLARIATQEYRRRTDSGMSAQEAAATPFAALSPYVPLGSMMELDKAFAHRLDIAKKTTGEEGLAVTRLFRMSTAPGTTPADTLFLLTRGSIGSRELLEDLFEWKLGKLVLKDPVRLQAIASLLRDTQASMQKLGFKGQFVEPRGELSDMQIVEAMSKLALSDMLSNADSLPLPQWQKDLLQYHVNTLGDAAYLLHIGQAYNAGRKAGTITQDMADILRDLGHEVHTVFDTAKIQQADIQAVMDARAIIDGRDPSGTPTASQIRERQQKDAEEEKAHITTGDKGKERSVPKEAYRHPETISLPEAPSSMQGVFANGASWNPDAGTWLGMVPVDKLHLSPEVPQVKVGSGKKGVVNPLVGDYRADAPPVYVWKRKNGRLEVVSGRHRLDLAQRTGTKNIPAYVYEEDAAHDAKWARLLDYEQNMQDDQADELTAAIYVRETGLTDAELTRRGLTRSGTKSRRGLLIGREARQELWSRFKSGLIKAQDAEAICLLTQHIQDKTRIDAIQAQAAADLAKGKSLDFAAAKIQLMIHAPQDGGMVQGLISFGASFDEALERSAEYVARCIAVINEHINAIKGVRTIAKKGTVMEAEGITAGLSADPAQRLRELELLKAMYEKIGLYENLRFRALAWDGKTPPDPIGDHRLDMLAEQARAQEEAAARQEEENRKASEALTPGLGFSLAPSPASGQSPANSFNRTSSIVLRTSDLPWFPSLWKEAARELNSSGRVSFSLNGSRIAIHTLSEEKMRHALKLGGMPNPAVQIADLDSGPTHYGEIACILHPERIDPAKTPGARIWRGDAWTRQMPEKISEDGDPWEGYEHGPDEIPWFYDEHGDLRKWNRENLDAYMKAKHLESFLPHNMTPDEVLDNYGDDGGAFPIIMASQAYAAEFPSLKEALRTDNLSFQLDRHEAETATRQLEDQFKALLGSYYFEPRSLQKFLMEYRHKNTTPETVLKALAEAWMIDAPDSLYDVEDNPEEYHDIESSNASMAEEIADFLTACRASAQSYYEAAPGGWLSPSDFSGFILPSSLEETLRPELEKYNVPIHTYELTEQEALALGNPWTLAKSPWLREEVDERRNAAIRDFLEDRDVSFSLFGEEQDSPSSSRDFPVPSSRFPLALSPTRLAEAFHAVRQGAPVAAELPPADAQDGPQTLSRLARQAYMALRASTRMADLPHHPRARRAELAKPLLRLSDGRTAHLGKAGWKRFMSSSPSLRSLAAMARLPSLVDSALYLYSVPSFDNDSPEQNRAWHYYLGRVQDSVHGASYVLLSFREDTRGSFFDGLETAPQKDIDQIGNVSARPDSGFIHRAKNGGSLPGNTLHAIRAFVNFVDAHQGESLAAPNGQPSRLTPDQWYLVRTAPFLDYFGDWIRDPSTSVVLDDNGEPLVCYRGLKQTYNPGVSRRYTWVSASRELSASYAAGGPVLDLFVAARRPFRLPDGLTRQSPDHFRETVKQELARDRKKNILTQGQYRAAARKLDTLLQGTQETEAFKLWERHGELKDILSSLGYDSVMTEENGVMTYGLFHPGQAKSAVGNCGSYDITLRDITFSLAPDASPANTPNRPSSILPRTPESFSLASLHDIVSSLAAPSMQTTRAADLVKDFGKAAENWRRVMSGKEEQPAAPVGAELYGMVSSLISSARLVLPPGYRSRVDLQMQWASVYAAMAESGQIPPKGSLRSGDAFYERFVTAMVNNTLAAASAEDARQILASIGSRRLDRVMSSVLDRVRTQLAYFAKDELYEKTMRRVEAVYPKKQPGKKSPRGRLEAQAMASLNALHNGEPDADKRREYEEDLLAWKTYGDYAGMSLPQAQAAMKQLLEFVMTGRSAWAAKLRQERGRAKYAARQIGRNLPAANNASSRAGSKIAYRTRLRKCLASLPYGFMSYSHLMLALEPVLGQRFSRERIKEITEANAALLNASNDRAAWLSAAIRRITGATSESAAEQWLVEFNTPQETGIILKPAITVQITLPVEEARDWLALTKDERAARRKEIRKNDAIAETLTENVPEEEDIPLLRHALDDYESRTPDQQQYQRFLTTEREIEGEENAFPLTCSRDCALYAILLHEQDDYADKYDEDGKLIRKGFLRREGFDEAAMVALYEFVGPAGLAYGYALREKLNETGQTLAHVYEERMGVPFALKENYFRATFDRNSTREKDTLAEPQGGAIAAGKYGSLIERVPHAENLDFSRAASLVFLAAAAEQDNYIHTSHITAFWRALLLDKRLEQKLRQNLGEDLMGKLASWLDLIDGASLENNRAFLHLSRMQGMLQRAFAFSVLAGNGYVLLKQSTAILHGFFAGWAPSGVLERADGSHELAHRHISFSSFLFHLAASNMGLGEISLKEVAQTPYFTARMRGEGAVLAQIASQMPGQRYSRLEKPAEKLMNLIEAVDVKANLHAMHALANACYARALQMNREHGNPFTEAQLRAAALEQVGLSLELGAQPLTKTQKSMNQAAGGILSRLAFVMKSEQLNKLGLMAAQWKTGSARNRVCAVQSWLSLGVASSLLAWFIAWLKGQEEDEEEEKKWRKYGATALLGDLTSIPLAGEGVNYLASLFTGQRVFADNYARTLIDVGAITRSVKKEYEHLAQKKEMDWDAHFNNLTAIVRAAGVGGAFSRSPSAVLSGYGALSLSAASGANLSRTSKDLLTALFAPPKKKKRKKK